MVGRNGATPGNSQPDHLRGLDPEAISLGGLEFKLVCSQEVLEAAVGAARAQLTGKTLGMLLGRR
jgi:hypothetical protein